MKKSRTGLAILLILFLVAGFVVVLVAVSLVSDSDKETSTWSQVFESGNKIGVINLEGTIASSDETLKQLRKYSKKSSVKAILIRINSPGGTVAPAQEIYREIGKIKKNSHSTGLEKRSAVSFQIIAKIFRMAFSFNDGKITSG